MSANYPFKMYSISVGLFLLAVSYISAQETSTYSTIEPEDLLSTFDQFYETVTKISFDSDLTHFVPTLNTTSITTVTEGKKKGPRRTTTRTVSPANQNTLTTLGSTEEDEKRWETAVLPEDTAPHLYEPPSPWTVPPRVKSFTGNYTRNPKYPSKRIYGNYTPPFMDEHYKNYQAMFHSPPGLKPIQGYGQPPFPPPHPAAPQQAPHYGPPQQGQYYGPPQQSPFYGPPQSGPYTGPPQQSQDNGPPQQSQDNGPPQQSQANGPPQQSQANGPPQQSQANGPPQPRSDSPPKQWTPTHFPPAGAAPSQMSPGGQQPQPLLNKEIELHQIPNNAQLDQGYYRGPPRQFYKGRFSDQQNSPGQNNRSQFTNNYSRPYRRRFDGFRRWPQRNRPQPYWPNNQPYPHPGGYWPGINQGQGPYPFATPPQLMPTPLQAAMPPPRPLEPPHLPPPPYRSPPQRPSPQQPVSPPPPPPHYQRPPYVPPNPPGQNPYANPPGSYIDPRYPNYQPYPPPPPPPLPQSPSPQQHAPQYPYGPSQSNPNWPPNQNYLNPYGHPNAINEGNERFQYPPGDPKVNRQRNQNNKPQPVPPPNPHQEPNNK